MIKLGTLALILALTGCNKASDSAVTTEASNTKPDETAQQQPKGRSGKIELPKIAPAAPTPKLPAEPNDDGRAERRTRWDKDGDGQLSDDERQARRDARRAERDKRLDTDGDGKVSEQEREAGRLQRDADRVARMDTDGDGKVSDEERRVAETERATNRHAQYDTNGDGKLTVDELANARGFRGDASKADLNGDGVVSTDELQKAMSERRAARRGGNSRRGE
jgi:hypothetical protein